MFPTLARRLAPSAPAARMLSTATKATAPPRDYTSIVYQPKKVWPPDFSKLSQKEQFRLEKRHKRRVVLASSRPRWDQYIRLAQLGSVTMVLIYAVLFMDWKSKDGPLTEFRNSFWGMMGSFSSEKKHEQRRLEPTPTDQR
ncbi:hypothetical protein GGS21DRAFT_486985 [Xylaria nigripes]|nr:hypothetical protein GGS21DRAFT_486985 [Xylaria nigripes]